MKSSTSWPWSRKYSAIVRPGEADAQARARRLVHLPVDERDLVDHLGLGHLEEEVVALARPLADAGEDGDAAVLRATLWISSWIRTVLPMPAPPKRPILPPFTYGAIRSTTLRPVSKISMRRRELAERGRVAVDRPALDVRAGGLLVVDRLADHVPDPAERRVADGDRDRLAGVDDVGAAREPVGRVHRDGADAIVAEVLLHLRDQRPSRRRRRSAPRSRARCRSPAARPGRRRRSRRP